MAPNLITVSTINNQTQFVFQMPAGKTPPEIMLGFPANTYVKVEPTGQVTILFPTLLTDAEIVVEQNIL